MAVSVHCASSAPDVLHAKLNDAAKWEGKKTPKTANHKHDNPVATTTTQLAKNTRP